jgi:hypothetical protein
VDAIRERTEYALRRRFATIVTWTRSRRNYNYTQERRSNPQIEYDHDHSGSATTLLTLHMRKGNLPWLIVHFSSPPM